MSAPRGADEWKKAIKAWVKATRPKTRGQTRASYMRWRGEQADPLVFPSANEITPDRWLELCAEAGIEGYVRDHRSPTHTDADLVAALRAAAAGSGTISESRYIEWVRANPGEPSYPTQVRRFESWSNAVAAAGLESGNPGEHRRHNIDDKSLLRAVRAFLRDEKVATVRNYDKWARKHKHPSAEYVVGRFGSWPKVKAAAARSKA